jgi:hypothetical protein
VLIDTRTLTASWHLQKVAAVSNLTAATTVSILAVQDRAVWLFLAITEKLLTHQNNLRFSNIRRKFGKQALLCK